jgi:predicted HTH domain antitoxin
MQLTTGTITFPEELPYSLKESKEGFMKLVLLYAAMKLFEEGKLSLGKAARLAGYSRIAFIDILSQHHISVLSIVRNNYAASCAGCGAPNFASSFVFVYVHCIGFG